MLHQTHDALEELLKFYEAVAIRLPLAMTEALSAIAVYSISELEQWRLMGLVPAVGSFSATGPAPPPARGEELQVLAAELETMRANLRSEMAGKDASIAALTADVERVHSEFKIEIKGVRSELRTLGADKNASNLAAIAEIRSALQEMRDELGAVSAKHHVSVSALAANTSGLDALRTDVRAVRDEFRSALAEKDAAIGDHAAQLRSIQADLRALRDALQPAAADDSASIPAAPPESPGTNRTADKKGRTPSREDRKPRR